MDFTRLLFPKSHPIAKKNEEANARADVTCRCRGCKGVESKGSTFRLLNTPDAKVKCAWKHKHWEFLTAKQLPPRRLDRIAKSVPALKAFKSPHSRHLAAMHLAWNRKLQKPYLILDTSQNLGRENRQKQRVPCITPAGRFIWLKVRPDEDSDEKALMRCVSSSLKRR